MIYLFLFQHIILAIKLLIAYAIPDVPEAIATKKAKLEFLRRIAFKVCYVFILLTNENILPHCVINEKRKKFLK
jgi:hypothetical protein